MSSPTLLINRIVVDGDLTVDLPFDPGLNIVQAVATGDDRRTSNRSGKTTLVELIQHGLGRRQKSKPDFYLAPIADRLRTLWLEIQANDTILTIERPLQEIFASLRVREGSYFPGIERAPSELVSVEDLSDVLLSALGIPKIGVKRSDGRFDFFSFPLLMRAFVLHQDDSFGAILDKVEPEQRRGQIVGFLTSITPIERYTIDEKRAEIQREVDTLQGQYNAVREFLFMQGVPTLAQAQEQVRKAEEDRDAAIAEQRAVQDSIRQNIIHDSAERAGRLDELRQRLLSVKEEISKLTRGLFGLKQEEERLIELRASLETDRQKSQRLQAASIILSSVDFQCCPRCLLEVTTEMRTREQYARCALCNRPLRTTSDTPPRGKPRTIDIDGQVAETNEVLADISREKTELNAKLIKLRTIEAEVGPILDVESQVYIAPVMDQLLARAAEVQGHEIKLARIRDLVRIANQLEEMLIRLNDLQRKQAEIEEQFEVANRRSSTLLNALREIYYSILDTVEFPNLRNCQINKTSLMPDINGTSYKTQGSALRGLAVVCFHLALLQLARQEETYFPKLLVIDSPAVADLNDENYDAFMHYLSLLQTKDVLERRTTDWQITLTTRRLTPELNPYVKLRISSPDSMLLRKST